MKYKVKWADTFKDSYIVTSETGYHLAPLEVEALLNPNRAEKAEVPNVIHRNGQYLIQVWTGSLTWSTYAYEGHIMLMDNPEIGTIARLPFGQRVKVIATGTEHRRKSDPPQLTVFVKPWPEIGVDGFIKD